MRPTSEGVGVSGGGGPVLAVVRLRFGVEGSGGTLNAVGSAAGLAGFSGADLLDLLDAITGPSPEFKGRFKS